MKNLKKVLALVMALATVFGCSVAASAAASDFTDYDEIENKEAVEVMNTLNVIGGYNTGDFKPDGYLTRAEMCKMVSFVMNGGNAPVLGTTAVTSYSDIKGHWAQDYIEYATSMGIVSGVGGGKFNPNGNLTGTQAAKMMLVAMGYDAKVFGFVGNGWDVNINRYANEAGLYKGLSDLQPNLPITRDQAAQLMYNAILAKTMSLSYTQDMQTGEISQTYTQTGASLFSQKFNGVVYEGVLESSGYMNPYTNGGAGKEKIGLACYYVDGDSQLTAYGIAPDVGLKYATDSTDMIGEYVKVLYNSKDKEAYGLYVNEDETTTVIETTVGALSDVNNPANTLTVDGTTYDVDAGANARFYNGTSWTNVSIMSLGSSTVANNYDNIKLIDNDGDEKIDTAIIVDNQIEKVTYVGSESVTLTNKGEVKSKDAVYSELAVDDYVSYVAAAYNYDNKAVLTKAETLSGKVAETSKNSGGAVAKIKVDGNWYTLGFQNGTTTPIQDDQPAELDYNTTYDLVLFNNYVVNAEKVLGNGSKVAVVAGQTSNTDYDGNVQVRLLLADGTTVEGYADLSKVAAISGTSRVGALVTYTIKDGVYQLVDTADTATDDANAGYDHYVSGAGFVKGTSSVTVAGKKVNDTAVVFVQYDKDLTTSGMQAGFKVITGAELNSWKASYGTSGEVLYNDSGLGYADIVYVVGAANVATPGIKTNTAYVTSSVTEGSDDTGVYTAFTIWDGTNSIDVIARSNASGVVKGSAITFDWDGEKEIKNISVLSNTTDTAALTYSNGKQVKLDSNGYDLADDVTIINVSTKDKTGVAGNSIAYAAQTSTPGTYYKNCWYKLNGDGEVELLIIDVTSNKLDGISATVTP